MRIGELAARVDINPRTIRYYEQAGLVPAPERSTSGYRRYGREDERRLAFIAGARRIGFGLGEIKEVLALRDAGRQPCSYVAATIERKRGEIARRIAELERLEAELDVLARRARRPQSGDDSSYCHILEETS